MATDMDTEESYQSPNNVQHSPIYTHYTSLAFHQTIFESIIYNMEKPHAKSAPKFTKATPPHATPGSSPTRGMMKNDSKDQLGNKAKATQKPPMKENTKPLDFTLHTHQRAVKRAMFNYLVATKLYLTELQKKYEERLQKLIEEEEVRLMRKEMIPRAQLMPLFDRPFLPQRSSRPPTVPREPAFRMLNSKC